MRHSLRKRSRHDLPFRRTSFHSSVLISALIHALAFLFASAAISFYHTPPPATPPESLAFSFLPPDPVDRADNHLVSRDPEPAARSVQKLPSPATSGNPAAPLQQDSPATSRPAARPKQAEPSPPADATPSFHVEDRASPRHHAVRFKGYGGVSPIRNRTRPAAATDQLKRAAISLEPREREIVDELIHRLAEEMLDRAAIDSTFSLHHNENEYQIRVQNRPAVAATDFDEIIVDISTNQHGKDLSTRIKARRTSFSHYAKFVDYWSPYVALHHDRIDGRFHSNSSIVVSSGQGVMPRIEGKFTMSAHNIRKAGDFPFIDYDALFAEGYETGVHEIRLPKQLYPFQAHVNAHDSSYLMIDEETWVDFQSSGSLIYRNSNSPNREIAIPQNRPFLILGSKKADIHVRGVVNGSVLVYGDGKIVIAGSLTYSSNPRFNVFADDYLGLVSREDIEVPPPEITGEGDLEIFASIFARRAFRVKDIFGNGTATLFIYGSLSAGSISATEPRFATDIRFDRRLESRRAPFFPMTDQYEIAEWDEKWHLEFPELDGHPNRQSVD